MEGYTRVLRVHDSSQIKEVAYDIKAKKLRVAFSNGAAYTYDGVPLFMFGELTCALSVGKFFNATIKDHFSATKVQNEVKK